MIKNIILVVSLLINGYFVIASAYYYSHSKDRDLETLYKCKAEGKATDTDVECAKALMHIMGG